MGLIVHLDTNFFEVSTGYWKIPTVQLDDCFLILKNKPLICTVIETEDDYH